MLDELRNLSYPGGKEDLLFFLQSIMGKRILQMEDIRILCGHAPSGYHLLSDALIRYCNYFGWINTGTTISLSNDVKNIIEDKNQLNRYLICSSLTILFDKGVLTATMFTYDVDRQSLIFRNELLPLHCAAIRNVLTSQGFLTVNRQINKTTFCVNQDYEKTVAQLCKKSNNLLSLEQLKKRLEENAIAGAKAEEFVLTYEKTRITKPSLNVQIKQISEIDVSAGYDIASFEDNNSTKYDRFIEVKAVSQNSSFFWSKNELEIAKLLAERYYLYLIDLSGIVDGNDILTIIQNPAKNIMDSDGWLVEPESYHIRRIDS